MQKDKNLPVRADTGEQLPEYMDDAANERLGLENLSASDLIVPRVLLMQGLSPMVTDTESGAKIGELRLAVTGQLVAPVDEALLFTPVFYYKEWIEWGDRDTNEGILDRSLDPKSALAQAAARREKVTRGSKEVDRVTETLNFISLIPALSLENPVVFSCAKTNHKKGRALLNLITFRGKKPLYCGCYSVRSAEETNKKSQKYRVFDFENAGLADEPTYVSAKALYPDVKAAYDDRRLVATGDDAAGGDPSAGEVDF